MKTDNCIECGTEVELCAIRGTDKTYAEFACQECGGAFCDACHDASEQFVYGDPADEDINAVCSECANKINQKIEAR